MTPTKKALALLFALALLISALSVSNLVDANVIPPKYLPKIVLDGSMAGVPDFGWINRTGFTYTLTADIEGYVLEVTRDNIVIDGAGHTINSSNGDSPSIEIENANGVTIKNVELCSGYTSIYLYYSSNCLRTNVTTHGRIYLTDGSNSNTIINSTLAHLTIGLGESNNNLIIKNTIRELFVGGSGNCFTQNNFLLADLAGVTGSNSWDNGSIGNYWGNYSVRYSNATEIGYTGIGDTPYVIEREPYTAKNYPDVVCVDYYPLMYPFDIEKDTIAFPTREPDYQSGTEENAPQVTLVTGISIVLIFGIVIIAIFQVVKHFKPPMT